MIRKFKVLAAFCCTVLVATASIEAQISRTVMVNSNSGIILYPTNFWTVNALAARAGLNLGTAAQSNASAFQPASSVLTNLSSGNAAVLTNVQASNIVGTVALASNVSGIVGLANGGTGASNAVGVRSNLGLSASWLTNTNPASFLTAIGVETNYSGLFATRPWLTNTSIPTFRSAVLPSYSGNTNRVLAVNSNGTDVEWVVQTGGGSITSGVVAITNGGTGATNAENARTNLGLGAAWLTNTVLTNFRTDIGLGTTNAVTFGSANILGASSVTGAVSFGQPAQTRTNLGLSLIALTNTNNANFRTAIELGPNNDVTFDTLALYALYKEASTNLSVNVTDLYLANTSAFSGSALNWGGSNSIFLGLPLSFGTNTHAAITRTNLGVPSSFGSGSNSAIGGGSQNDASGEYATISGGLGNIVSNNYTTVSGGINNRAQNLYATVSGGSYNQAVGQSSIVAGGGSGYASGEGSAVVGGYQNFATGDYSFAAGNKARATKSGSFVWADHQNNLASTFSSIVDDSFNIRASGGSYFNGGTLYVYNTNVGSFEGLINALNSNNTTLSNETLFRVGLAEETNRSAQFGFRVARTNNGGEGFAVFSVYGYNGLMMIGPSDRSRSNSITNTNAAIEADIYSISTTNKVMTLITTNTKAMQMHRPIGFNTNASTPSSTNTVTGWIEFFVGTNSVRVPYYQ
jgi:hypothetical protein